MDWSKMFTSRVVVFGCGNILMGDDGIGPIVIQELEQDTSIPDDTVLLDVGTFIRTLLFDILTSEQRPQRIVVVDATTEEGREPGEFWEIDIDEITPKKILDFSMHQFPSSNLLKEIRKHTGVEIKVLVIQTGYIPEFIEEGLSEPLQAALPAIKTRVKELILE